MKKFLELLKKLNVYIIFVIIILLILFVEKYDKQNRDEKDKDRVYRLTKQRIVSEQQKNSIVVSVEFSKIDNVFGNREAPVKIIEFSRFSCSYCVQFQNESISKIKKEYIDTGKVLYISRLIIDEDTLLGVVLPACLDNESEKYEIINQLYLKSGEWLKLENNEKVSKLKEIWLETAKSKNEKDFDDCIVDVGIGNSILEQQRRDTREFGLSATPTFIINGTKYENYYNYDDFIKLFDNE